MALIKFNCCNNIKSFNLWDDKQSIKAKINSEFGDRQDVRIMESKYSILVELNDFDKKANTSRLMLAVFDENEKLICIQFNHLKETCIKSIEINEKRVEIKDLDKFIKKGENFRFICNCPILNKEISFKDNEKFCGLDYVNCCNKCFHRSQMEISSDFKQFGIYIEYSLDDPNIISVIDISKKYEWYNKYGFERDELTETIIDKESLIECNSKDIIQSKETNSMLESVEDNDKLEGMECFE